MLADIKNHITLLHDRASGIDGVMVLASFGEKMPPVIRHFRVGNIDGMAQAAAELSQQDGRNIYMPLAVMRPDLPPSSKGTEKDVKAVLGFVADFDNGRGVDYAERCPVEPSYVQETSPNNAQCFFLLDKPLIVSTDADRTRAKELATRLTQACNGADSCGADLSHVWRIPGLSNWPNAKKLKDGREQNPFTVKVLKPFISTTISQSAITALAPIVDNKPDTKEAIVPVEYKKSISLDELRDNGNSELVLLIESGVPEGKRSEAVASVVWKLLERSYGTGDIVNVIYAHPKGIGERYSNDRSRIEADVLRLAAKKPDKNNTSDNKLPYILQRLEQVDESAIPPRPWLLGHHLMRGKVTVLIAPPGVGKSTVSFSWGLSIATGKNLFDLSVHESGAVAFINNEDDMNEMHRRIAAFINFYKISQSQLEGRFFLQSGENQQFTIAKRNNDKKFYPYHKGDLITFCRQHKIKALFVDPFLETHEADENDNRQISEVAKMYREVAQQADCAVCLVHHSRKQPGTSSEGHAGNMDSGRGASSLVGAARIVCTLYDMSEKDAKQYGVSEEERHRYLRLDDAKANLSLKSNTALWYRRESVSLLNGDNVGVLRVAHNLYAALPMSVATQEVILLEKVKGHNAFKELRDSGRMKREEFISAMIKSGVYLGRETKTRSTLQARANKYLLDTEVADDMVAVSMRKQNGHYFIYAEFADADLPEEANKKPAIVVPQDFTADLPIPAEIHRQNPFNTLKNHAAGLPPL